MAMFIPIQRLWGFGVIAILFIHRISCDKWFNLGLEKDACEMECQCYSWKSTINTTQRYNRFTVNCTGMKFGLFQGISIPKPLPFNTTDLLVTDYSLGTLGIESFDNNAFPLNPQLITLVLHNCHITYLSSITFHANSLQSLHHVDLSSNVIEKLHEDMFSPLSNVKSISVANNYIKEIERQTFRNLYQVKVINISHNWLKELDFGVFYRVPNLEVLDLSNNWLDTLPWENMSQLLSLKVLGLKGNPWNCSCQMKGILKVNRSLLNGTQAMCQYPQQINGTLLEDLKSDIFSYCFTTKQNFEMKYIITLFCIILTPLCLYCYKSYSKQSEALLEEPFETQAENPSKIQTDTPSNYKCIGKIGYNIDDAISWNVYRGKLSDGRKAVIKKHDRMKKDCKELRLLLHLSEKARPHPNIIQYLCEESDEEYTYLALELCDGDLMTAVMEGIIGFHDVDSQNYFLQLTSGICFLHQQGIQHRDIKPQNILWKLTVNGIALVISDLDMSHFSQEKSSHRMFGTRGWIAPELWNLKQSRSNAVDIFSLGCVFYFILTKGHPFGEISSLEECQQNIISSEYKVCLDALYEHFSDSMHAIAMAKDLIDRMIWSNASDRIEDGKIMKHPFLLKKEEMANFLNKIGDYMDEQDDPKVANFKDKLKEKSHIVFSGNWLDKLPDKKAKDDLSGFSKPGKADNICFLLRAVRNKIVHFRKFRSMELRDIYLKSEYGVIEYYTKLFPKLVTYTYDVLERSEIENFAF